MSGPLTNNFEIPSWAGKPPTGLHLDVIKESKMIQKLMIDEKKCYFFGRNKQMCDFHIDHASCSRIHTALIWHRHLNRPFLIDLGSTHGTFIGSIRLESKKPQQVPLDSEIHFGASTRKYVIRERPQTHVSIMNSDSDKNKETIEGGLLGLPETEGELNNLTEFNTAHNRRITSMSDLPDMNVNPLKRKRKSTYVTFNDEEEVINPEDIDPSIGRFRNLVQTTVIPTKRPRHSQVAAQQSNSTDSLTKKFQNISYESNLYGDMSDELLSPNSKNSFSFVSKLGLKTPNLAPNIDETPFFHPEPKVLPQVPVHLAESNEPRKKKYAKEAWPGKKPLPFL